MAGETVAETIAATRARRKRSKRRKTIALVCVAVIIVVGGILAYLAFSGDDGAEVTYRTEAAQLVTIIQLVSGTGSVNLNASESVVPEVSGTVHSLAVALGDVVEEGQLLFTLTNDELDLAVEQADNSYQQAVNSLRSAQLSLEEAQENLDDLHERYVEERWGSIDQNTDQRDSHLASLNTKPPTDTTTTIPTTTTTTEPTTTSTTISDLDIALAEQKVTSAQLSVQVAQTNLTLAKMDLEDAEADLISQAVNAPIGGTITELNIAEGDDVGSSSSSAVTASATSSVALVITDLTKWDVTVTLAESDVGSVEVGQKVNLIFDALEDVSLTGKVTGVDTTGTNSSGVVSYTATVTPDVTNESVLGGMTVTVDIITLAVADVIGVSSSAVKTAADGTHYVQVMGDDGVPVDTTVEIGSSDDTYIEITTGLTEGQEVVTATITAGDTTNTTAGGSILDGGGGLPGGGGIPGGGMIPSGGEMPSFPAGGGPPGG